MASLTYCRAVALASLTLALAPACGGGPSFDGRVYRNDELAFRVGPVPASWRRIDADAALIAYRDDATKATIAVNGRCGKDGDDVPLVALTHHLFLQFTEREVIDQRVLPMDGREAMRTEIVARLDGVPKHFTIFVLKKDGCVYDFLHIADTQAPGESRAEFERFVQGFASAS
jgi:hypothetical protein